LGLTHRTAISAFGEHKAAQSGLNVSQ